MERILGCKKKCPREINFKRLICVAVIADAAHARACLQKRNNQYMKKVAI